MDYRLFSKTISHAHYIIGNIREKLSNRHFKCVGWHSSTGIIDVMTSSILTMTSLALMIFVILLKICEVIIMKNIISKLKSYLVEWKLQDWVHRLTRPLRPVCHRSWDRLSNSGEGSVTELQAQIQQGEIGGFSWMKRILLCGDMFFVLMEKEDKKPYLEKQVHKEYLIIHKRHKANIVTRPQIHREISPVFELIAGFWIARKSFPVLGLWFFNSPWDSFWLPESAHHRFEYQCKWFIFNCYFV